MISGRVDMTSLFITFINMSLTASLVILVVICLRLLLKKFPKVYSYFLWFVVIFRLLCPISLEFSRAPVKPVDVRQEIKQIEENDSHEVVTLPSVEHNSDAEIKPSIEPVIESSEKQSVDLYQALSYVWVIGITAMLTWGVYSWVSIKSRLKNSQKEDGYYSQRVINNSFIFGFVKPRIYIPAYVSENERIYILKHEQAHLRRGDHITKMIMYIALCLHWFNPLVWLSFKFFEQDMEMSCDEEVTAKMDRSLRAQYADALLKASAKPIAAFTSCFGESNVKRRIKNVLNFKKPTNLIVILCTLLVLTTSCTLATNKSSEIAEDNVETSKTESTETKETDTDETLTNNSDTKYRKTPNLYASLSDGTYNAEIHMCDPNETERLEISTWDYFEMKSSDVENLKPGDKIDITMTPFGEVLNVDSITPLLSGDDSGIERYGYTYDQIIKINEEYWIWHVKDSDTWRLFEIVRSAPENEYQSWPVMLWGTDTCMPLSKDLVIYDYAGYNMDGGKESGKCNIEKSFATTYLGREIIYNIEEANEMVCFGHSPNVITVENGEITSVTIFMHP